MKKIKLDLWGSPQQSNIQEKYFQQNTKSIHSIWWMYSISTNLAYYQK
jgi:hypothetical protein